MTQMPDNTKNDSLIFTDHYHGQIIFVPKNIEDIIHRDTQIKDLSIKLSPLIKGHTTSPIVLLGRPGTGKGIILNLMLNKIKELTKHDIIVLYTDCVAFSTPTSLLRYLIQNMEDHLNKKLVHPSRSISELIDKFAKLCSLHEDPIIIILDNIEFLKGSKILHQLNRLNETHNIKNVQLIIPTQQHYAKDRNIDSLLRSPSNIIFFPPYSVDELIDILSSFVKTFIKPKAVENNIIEMCAAITSAEGADAYQAINLLVVAGEEAEYHKRSVITEEDILNARYKNKMQIINQIINSLPLQNVTALFSLYLAEKISSPYSKKELGFSSPTTYFIYKIYKKVNESINLEPLSSRRIADIFQYIESLALINTKTTCSDIPGLRKEISLNITEDQLLSSLKISSVPLPDIEQFLPTLQPIVQDQLDYIVSLKELDEEE